MSKVPKSVYAELERLERKLEDYKQWKKDDEEKIRALKELWKIN